MHRLVVYGLCLLCFGTMVVVVHEGEAHVYLVR